MRKIFYQIHLWLGLVSGLLVFLIALTGALYAFQDEISSLANYRNVKPQAKSYLLPSELQKIAENKLPGKELHGIKYNKADESVEAVFYGYGPTYYNIVYLNPYNGEVLKVKDMNRDFFRFVITGHYYLWLPPKIGQPLVACSTMVFVILIISGLIIWVPKNFKSLKNRTWFRWKKGTKWPRINFDLHVVGGLYVALFALIFALTGLVWGFQWFANGYYKMIGGEKNIQYIEPISQMPDESIQKNELLPVDKLWLQMKDEYPTAVEIEMHPASSESAALAVQITREENKHWKNDYRYFDQYSLKEIESVNIFGKFEDAAFADKLFRMNYEIHTGAILGFPGKLFAFLMSLFIASLPVSGFVIWLKRRNKK